MIVTRYEVLGFDPRRARWRRRLSVEARINRVRHRFSSAIGIARYLDTIARERNERLQLIAIVHEAWPRPCLRVVRTPAANPGAWTLDADLTVALLGALDNACHDLDRFNPDYWLLLRTRRRTSYHYRIARD